MIENAVEKYKNKERSPHVITDAGDYLLCPICANEYMAHETIEVFDHHEGNKQETHITISEGKMSSDHDLSGNPSGKRNGLKISFKCENCKRSSVLKIAQQEGLTYMAFEV
ncbi:MAG: hypothetical protein COA85_06910 [Robiginitomaculum sp.]|nr:MAG: hypothetical protein COA85_06910 [Robiginitomaculum sp.]